VTAPRLPIDFGPRPQRRWLGWLVLVPALLAGWWLLEHQANMQAEFDALQADTEQLHQRLLPTRQRVAPPDAETLRKLARANMVIDELSLPWRELFRAVEAADIRGMGLLALVPNTQDRTLRLSGEARNLAVVHQYVDRLAAQKPLAGVHLVSYDTVDREGSKVVTFSLTARWQQP
jgi:type II secretory pathway component PulL